MLPRCIVRRKRMKYTAVVRRISNGIQHVELCSVSLLHFFMTSLYGDNACMGDQLRCVRQGIVGHVHGCYGHYTQTQSRSDRRHGKTNRDDTRNATATCLEGFPSV